MTNIINRSSIALITAIALASVSSIALAQTVAPGPTAASPTPAAGTEPDRLPLSRLSSAKATITAAAEKWCAPLVDLRLELEAGSPAIGDVARQIDIATRFRINYLEARCKAATTMIMTVTADGKPAGTLAATQPEWAFGGIAPDKLAALRAAGGASANGVIDLDDQPVPGARYSYSKILADGAEHPLGSAVNKSRDPIRLDLTTGQQRWLPGLAPVKGWRYAATITGELRVAQADQYLLIGTLGGLPPAKNTANSQCLVTATVDGTPAVTLRFSPAAKEAVSSQDASLKLGRGNHPVVLSLECAGLEYSLLDVGFKQAADLYANWQIKGPRDDMPRPLRYSDLLTDPALAK